MFLRVSMLILFVACLFVAIPLVDAQLPLDGVVSYWLLMMVRVQTF